MELSVNCSLQTIDEFGVSGAQNVSWRFLSALTKFCHIFALVCSFRKECLPFRAKWETKPDWLSIE